MEKVPKTIVVITGQSRSELNYIASWTKDPGKQDRIVDPTNEEIVLEVCRVLGVSREDLLVKLPSKEIADLGDL